MNFAAIESYLPPMIRTIVELIGVAATEQLVAYCGGTSLLVPKRISPAGMLQFDILAEQIGLEHAEALCQRFGGEKIYFASCKEALRMARDIEIRAEFDRFTRKGHTAPEAVFVLARRYQKSDRQIWRILKQSPDSTTPRAEQKNLF